MNKIPLIETFQSREFKINLIKSELSAQNASQKAVIRFTPPYDDALSATLYRAACGKNHFNRFY